MTMAGNALRAAKANWEEISENTKGIKTLIEYHQKQMIIHEKAIGILNKTSAVSFFALAEIEEIIKEQQAILDKELL